MVQNRLLLLHLAVCQMQKGNNQLPEKKHEPASGLLRNGGHGSGGENSSYVLIIKHLQRC